MSSSGRIQFSTRSLLLFGHSRAAKCRAIAAFAAVMLHLILCLSLDDGDRTPAMLAFVLGADFHPASRSLAVGPIGFIFRHADGFARTTRQHHGASVFHFIHLFCRFDLLHGARSTRTLRASVSLRNDQSEGESED